MVLQVGAFKLQLACEAEAAADTVNADSLAWQQAVAAARALGGDAGELVGAARVGFLSLHSAIFMHQDTTA
jgi:hypothetical protein